MPWSMSWRGLTAYGLVDLMLHINQVDQASLEEWAHGVGHDDLGPVLLTLRPVLPFRTGHEIACPRERRHPLPLNQACVPAHMVRMQMRADDGIKALGRIPCRSELREEWTLPFMPGGNAPFFIIPNARVHHNTLIGDFQHQRMHTPHRIAVGR